MARTDNFRRQHDDILALANELAALLDPAKLAQDAAPARSKLATLAGKLKVHLAMEDQSLYPTAAASAQPELSALAVRYQNEMGDIKEAFEAYLAKWPSPTAIQANPDGFVADTKGIYGALAERVRKENTELYPLVDALN